MSCKEMDLNRTCFKETDLKQTVFKPIGFPAVLCARKDRARNQRNAIRSVCRMTRWIMTSFLVGDSERARDPFVVWTTKNQFRILYVFREEQHDMQLNHRSMCSIQRIDHFQVEVSMRREKGCERRGEQAINSPMSTAPRRSAHGTWPQTHRTCSYSASATVATPPPRPPPPSWTSGVTWRPHGGPQPIPLRRARRVPHCARNSFASTPPARSIRAVSSRIFSPLGQTIARAAAGRTC